MWKQCSEKYEASTDGHVRNMKTKRVLHEFIGKDGYLRTQFDGKTRLVHRVIAQTFLDNPLYQIIFQVQWRKILDRRLCNA